MRQNPFNHTSTSSSELSSFSTSELWSFLLLFLPECDDRPSRLTGTYSTPLTLNDLRGMIIAIGLRSLTLLCLISPSILSSPHSFILPSIFLSPPPPLISSSTLSTPPPVPSLAFACSPPASCTPSALPTNTTNWLPASVPEMLLVASEVSLPDEVDAATKSLVPMIGMASIQPFISHLIAFGKKGST